MAAPKQIQAGDPQPADLLDFHRQGHRRMAAIMMMVVTRSLFPAMPMLFGAGRVMMVMVVIMAAVFFQQAPARSMARSHREPAGVQPGEHAENCQPCEQHSH
ncbi:MAG: hypothetical protein WED15_01575 [Akkermansiaceae bacterium]